MSRWLSQNRAALA